MKMLSPLLLHGAEVYFMKLQEITNDFLINEVLWKEMLGRISDEWRDFTIYVRLYNFAYHSTY